MIRFSPSWESASYIFCRTFWNFSFQHNKLLAIFQIHSIPLKQQVKFSYEKLLNIYQNRKQTFTTYRMINSQFPTNVYWENWKFLVLSVGSISYNNNRNISLLSLVNIHLISTHFSFKPIQFSVSSNLQRLYTPPTQSSWIRIVKITRPPRNYSYDYSSNCHDFVINITRIFQHHRAPVTIRTMDNINKNIHNYPININNKNNNERQDRLFQTYKKILCVSSIWWQYFLHSLTTLFIFTLLIYTSAEEILNDCRTSDEKLMIVNMNYIFK